MAVDHPTPLQRRQFASDNYAGVTPEAWQSLAQANAGHATAYGDDAWTAFAIDLVRQLFETDCDVFFTFNGTAANSLALASMCRSHHGVICHQRAHIQTDECGAPEFFTGGAKLLLIGGDNGKVDIAQLEAISSDRVTDVHFSKARALSITQATELGTVYRKHELAALNEVTKRHNLAFHMDGARFANAVAALEVAPREITWEVGVDVLSLGGTKLGMPVGDVLVFFDRTLAEEFAYRRKQAGQLASKMRFLAAPWIGMLKEGVWLRYARYTNGLAKELSAALAQIDGVELLFPTEANGVFVRLPKQVIQKLRKRGWLFYTFIGQDGVRLLCSWDTSREDIENLVADVRQCMGPSSARCP